MTFIQKGTIEYQRASFALFLGGFLTFGILYTTQPLIPVFAQEFHVSPTAASLSLSVSTGVLAIAMLAAASILLYLIGWGKNRLWLFPCFSQLFLVWLPHLVLILFLLLSLGSC